VGIHNVADLGYERPLSAQMWADLGARSTLQSLAAYEAVTVRAAITGGRAASVDDAAALEAGADKAAASTVPPRWSLVVLPHSRSR